MLYSRFMRQVELEFRTWGGRRKGAGRPKSKGSGVPHVPRPALAGRRFPVHATWRMAEGVWNLRSRRSWAALAPALYGGGQREDFRVIHFAIMGNHIHLMVEASDRMRLARGLQGLGVRMAVRLNRLRKRGGRVVGDRYHARILKTPTEVRNVRHYLLTNAQKHYQLPPGPDLYTSQFPVALPHTWLMRQHC